jgi:hypothetical protein
MDSLSCADLKIKKYKGLHGVPHFFLTKEGNLRQYVDEDDIAWGFPQQLAVAEPDLSLFDWQLVTDNPDVPIDYYTLQIGIEKDLFVKLDDCNDCHGIKDTKAYKNLVQLVSWLAQEHQIPKDIFHIEFHQNIDAEAEDECGDCLNSFCLVCDVNEYCQACKYPADAKFKLGDVVVFYGENEFGCLTKISLADLADAIKPLLV